jgi:hypothetical protein
MAHQLKINCSGLAPRVVANNVARIVHYCGLAGVPVHIDTPPGAILTFTFENESDMLQVRLAFAIEDGMIVIDKYLKDGVSISCK